MDGGAFEISDGQAPVDRLNDGEWRDFAPSEDLWGGKEVYCRFRQVITVPERMKGRDIFYTLSAAEDGAWSHTTKPHFILFVKHYFCKFFWIKRSQVVNTLSDTYILYGNA